MTENNIIMYAFGVVLSILIYRLIFRYNLYDKLLNYIDDIHDEKLKFS